MKWEKQKVILSISGVVLLSLMIFLIGVAFGVSTSGTEFKEMILPVLDVVGSWVSGVGALGAVVVALWLAEVQRKSDKEDLKVSLNFVLVPGVSNPVLMISAVSVGKRPSEVNSIVIYDENASSQMLVIRFLPGSSEIPINIGYGKKASWLCEEGFERHIGSYLKNYCNGTANNMKICISTTTENFIHSPSTEMKKTLESYSK